MKDPMNPYEYKTIEELNGETLVLCEWNRDEAVFTCASGRVFRMFHEQDCCETVTLEAVDGDKNDLIGATVESAKEVFPPIPADLQAENESCKLTDFIIRTDKGQVDFHWFGSSNGYYSESVHFVEMT